MVEFTGFVVALLNGMSIGFSIALIAIGLTLVFGIMDIVNFAHGEFYMLGAYGIVISLPIVDNIIISLVLAVVVVAGIAFLIERLTLKPIRDRDPIHSLIVTFAFVLLIPQAVASFYSTSSFRLESPFSGSVDLGVFVYSQHRLMVILTSLALIGFVFLLLTRTRLGIVIRASAQDLEMARANGISGDKVFLGVFVFGAMLAAIASLFLAPIRGVYPTMGVDIVIDAFIVVIVGGLGSVFGAVIVALLIGIIASVSVFWVPPFVAELMKFGVFILVLALRPQGLFAREEV